MKTKYFIEKKINKYLLLLVLFLFFVSVEQSYSQTWKKISGVYPYINRIILDKDNTSKIIVSSNELETDYYAYEFAPPIFGTGYKVSTDKGETFGDNYLNLYNVFDICVSPQNVNTWYASVHKQIRSGIAVSTDAGANWETTTLKNNVTYNILKFTTNTTVSPTIFAGAVGTSSGFVYSSDGFESCSTNSELKVQVRDLAFSPKNQSLLFLAGDNFYGGGVYRSYDNGKTWMKDESGIENLRIHCVLPSIESAAIVFCGADSTTADGKVFGKGIYKSIDTGKTWQLVGAKGYSVMSIAQHPDNPLYMAAAGDISGVWASRSYGNGWEQQNDGLPATFSVRQVVMPHWDIVDSSFAVLAAVYNDGLYKTQKYIRTAVENNETTILTDNYSLNVYPNPCSGNLTVQLYSNANQRVSISLYDMQGNLMLQKPEELFNVGNYTIPLDLSKFSSGIYNLVLRVGTKVHSERIFYQK